MPVMQTLATGVDGSTSVALHWRCINSILGDAICSATSYQLVVFPTVWPLTKPLGESGTADNKGSCRRQKLPSYCLEPTKQPGFCIDSFDMFEFFTHSIKKKET